MDPHETPRRPANPNFTTPSSILRTTARTVPKNVTFSIDSGAQPGPLPGQPPAGQEAESDIESGSDGGDGDGDGGGKQIRPSLAGRAPTFDRLTSLRSYKKTKRSKLQNSNKELHGATATQHRQIFAGLAIHVNGLTRPPAREIRRIVVVRGGKFLTFLDDWSEVTHIVATQLAGGKAQDYLVKGVGKVGRVGKGPVKVVTPEWILECVKEDRIVGCERYALESRSSGRPNPFLIPAKPDGPSTSRTSPAQKPQPTFLLDRHVGQRPSATGSSLSTGLDLHEEIQTASPPPSPTTASPLQSEPPPGTITPPGIPLQSPQPNNKTNDPKRPPTPNSDPEGFIKAYYASSRLHHLSAWRTSLQQIISNHQRDYPPTTARMPRRYIVHADFDAFFATVSGLQWWKRNNAFVEGQKIDLSDIPIAVSHGSGPTSAVASCNYAARKFGVRNGVFMRDAKSRCPGLVVVGYEYDAYERASQKFYNAVLSMLGESGCVIRGVSVDEVIADISCVVSRPGLESESKAVQDEIKAARAIGASLRHRVASETGCTISVAIAPNKLLARLALRLAKPDGMFVLPEDQGEVEKVLLPLTVKDLPGVGRNFADRLAKLGVSTVLQLREIAEADLVTEFGPKMGAKLYRYARGVDDEPLAAGMDSGEDGDSANRKTVSCEITWGVRLQTMASAERFVTQLCAEVHRRLVANGLRCRNLGLRLLRRAEGAPVKSEKYLGHGECVALNRSATLVGPTDAVPALARSGIGMLRRIMKEVKVDVADIRGLGIHASSLTTRGGSQTGLGFQPVKGSPNPEPSEEQSRSSNHDKPAHFNPSTPSKQKRTYNDEETEITTPTKVCEHEDAEVIAAIDRFAAVPGADNVVPHPLNLSGSQFLLPSQVDPDVLAELGDDIRRRLFRPPARPGFETPAQARRQASPSPTTPAPAAQNRRVFRRAFELDVDLAPPRASQIDPDALAALPVDIREEVLGAYSAGPGLDAALVERVGQVQVQQQQQQQPARANNRSAAAGRKRKKAAAKDGTMSIAQFMARCTTRRDPPAGPPSSTLRPPRSREAVTASPSETASSRNNPSPPLPPSPPSPPLFVALRPVTPQTRAPATPISVSFLAALPEDLREEARAQARHLARALQQPDPSHRTAPRPNQPAASEPDPDPALDSDPAPDRPSGECPDPSRGRPGRDRDRDPIPPVLPFHTTTAPTVDQVRALVGAWAAEFPAGPYREDVCSLAGYLSAVVTKERDMAKAVAVGEWLGRCVRRLGERAGTAGGAAGAETESGEPDEESISWPASLEIVRTAIEEAVLERTRRQRLK